MKDGDKLYTYCGACRKVTSHTMTGDTPVCNNC